MLEKDSVILVIGLVNGGTTDFDGEYVVEYDLRLQTWTSTGAETAPGPNFGPKRPRTAGPGPQPRPVPTGAALPGAPCR
jgi:hypothetical protein